MSRFYKRLLTFLMTASISCSLVSANTIAADEAEVKAQSTAVVGAEASSEQNIPPEIRKMMYVLKTFKVIPDYYDYNFPLTYEVSRSDFAASVARMMGKTTYSGSDVYFYDVPKTYWAFNEISNLTEMGILNGVEDKIFNPSDPITKGAAYKILLCAMGYGGYAEQFGEYPANYATVASHIKLSDGVSSGGILTMSDMLHILYNSLTINIMETGYSADYAISYKVSDDETLISSCRDIYYGEGTVNGANSVTIYGGRIKQEDALIDNKRYSCEGIDMMAYFGERIEFFYEDNELSGVKKLLWVERKSVSQDIKEIFVDGDAELDTDSFTYTYYEETRKHKIKLDRSILLVYNGGIIDSDYDKILNKKRYDLKLVSVDGKYTVMVVREYENYVVGSINTVDRIIYDKNNPQNHVKLDEGEYDSFTIKLMGSNDMSFEEITKDAVLTVYQSKDKKHIEVYVSYSLVNGVIEYIDTSDKTKVNINGNEYRVDKNVPLSSFAIGDDVTAYTNVYGEVAYITVKTGNYRGSFLIRATLDEIGEAMYIRQLGEDSKVSSLKCIEKVVIDGKRYKNAKTAYQAIVGGADKLTPQFALIKTNENGDIREIDTTVYNTQKETSSSLQIDVPFWYGSETTYTQRIIRATSGATRIGEKIVFDANTKIFVVPNVTDYDTVSDDDFYVTYGSKLANDTGTFAQSYKTEEEIGIAKYILLKGYDPNRVKAELPVLVQKISHGVDDDGNAIEVLKGYQGTAEVSIKADESVSDLFSKNGVQSGDIVTITRDNNGKVKGCTVAYDYRTDEHNALSGLNDISGMFVGYANNVVDDVVKIGYTSGAECNFAINSASKPVLVYDTTKTKDAISVATTGDIITYYNDPSNCSTVFIATTKMQPQLFIIYK